MSDEETKQAILKQVEFYFSDENLPTDKFLFKTSQKNDGWVPISTVCMFKRMQKYRPIETVVEALKESKELLEVSEDNELVRRKKPLVEPKKEQRQDAMSRSIYVKGFDTEEKEDTQEELEKFFQQFGNIKQLRMRRDNDKKFKGSVFCEFEKVSECDKFISDFKDSEDKPKFQDMPIETIMKKREYVEMKAKEKGIDLEAQEREQQQQQQRKRKFNAFKQNKGGNKRFKRGGDRRQDRNEEKAAEGAAEEKTAETKTEDKAAAPAPAAAADKAEEKAE